MPQQINKSILFPTNASRVWELLTTPQLMKTWMGEPEMGIKIKSDWQVNGPIVISGFHHAKFENKGVIVKLETNKLFSYTHLNSISKLEDKPENYTTITFELSPQKNQTLVTLTITNFPTEIIFKHLEFYWVNTLEIIKKIA